MDGGFKNYYKFWKKEKKFSLLLVFVIFRKIGKLSNLNLDNDNKILESLHREYKCHKKIIVVVCQLKISMRYAWLAVVW